MSGAHREAVQKQIHQDWANREYIEVITASIKRITDFLNSFGKCSLHLRLCIHMYIRSCICVHCVYPASTSGHQVIIYTTMH